VVLSWYLTGRHVSRQQIKQIYRQAFARGKHIARNLIARLPGPRLLHRDSRRRMLSPESSSNPDSDT
ncbi:MAG: hypothetical protein IBX69_14830, partial [Anaerolineales bacterium]|nr:hypothetical protein [Anaerolineales bacterium]